MRILIIGSGGREHAICWALAREESNHSLWVSPGNAGTKELAKSVLLPLNDHESVIEFCKEESIDLVVVGPEAPLVDGICDVLSAANIPTLGPSKAAAFLEGSKAFCKEICVEQDIPTAAAETFTDAAKAKDYVHQQGVPIVIKADGLAAGKGVIIAMTAQEAEEAIDSMLSDHRFGSAGDKIVIEEYLEGEEISVFALCDGDDALFLGAAQDHKRAFDGDTGPNTGGMGTYSPSPLWNESLQNTVMKTMVQPVLDAMKNRDTEFAGILFVGVMVTAEGPKLLEYNVRFGDPETQVVLPRITSDLSELFLAAATKSLKGKTVSLRDDAALCVVMAANGYPNNYEKGSVITGIEHAKDKGDVVVFHAGTREDHHGHIVANGGRVLGVTALAPTLKQAQHDAYAAAESIHWPEGFFRRDIGWRALKKNSS